MTSTHSIDLHSRNFNTYLSVCTTYLMPNPLRRYIVNKQITGPVLRKLTCIFRTHTMFMKYRQQFATLHNLLAVLNRK